MSEFSDYLDGYMREMSISSAYLAEEMNIERTTIYRYRKGSRVPADEEVVVQIADFLQMNENERQNLIKKYELVSIGETLVNSYRYVEELFRNLKYETDSDLVIFNRSKIMDEFEGSTFIPLNSASDIISCIYTLFSNKLSPETGSVRILMQPVYEPVNNIMRSELVNSNVSIEHIVCFEQNQSKSYVNLQTLYQILRNKFLLNHYNVMYYYDFLSHHVNGMSNMPNMIIAGEYVVQFDFEMSCGIMVNDMCHADVMRREFEKIKKQSRNFFRVTVGLLNYLEIFKMDKREIKLIYYQPCLGMSVSSDIYEKYLYPFAEKQSFIDEMRKWNGDWDDMTYIPPIKSREFCLLSVGKLEGLRTFMETGRINEFPSGFYNAFGMEVRKKILWRMYMLISEGYIEYSFLSDVFNMPDNVAIYLAQKKLIINYISERTVSCVEIEEMGVVRTLKNFFEYVKLKNLVVEKEQALKAIENLYKDYR